MELGKNVGTMAKAQVRHQTIVKRLLHSWQLYVLIAPATIYFAVCHYWPIYGLQKPIFAPKCTHYKTKGVLQNDSRELY